MSISRDSITNNHKIMEYINYVFADDNIDDYNLGGKKTLKRVKKHKHIVKNKISLHKKKRSYKNKINHIVTFL